MKEELRIVTVLKSGGRYEIADVRRISDSLAIHMPAAKLYCLFDKTSIPFNVFGVTFIPMHIKEWQGWWAKMNLFASDIRISQLRPFLYIDLDTLILGNFEGVIPEDKNMFVTSEDFYYKTKLASSMMWIPSDNKKVYFVWQYWMFNPSRNMQKYRSDQEFLRSVCKADAYFQDYYKGIGDFKPLPRMRPLQKKPKKASIVCFHGKPSIPEAAKNIEWVRKEIENEILQ